uniref:M23 family metallopeptidase n=1 Tax=Arthrobacter globiformis TaxID=1665 RepID=UPI00209C51F9
MAKHLEPAADRPTPAVDRRTPQDSRPAVLSRGVLSRAVRVGAGTAFLAVYAVGFPGSGPVLSSGQLPAEVAAAVSVNAALGSGAVASDSVSGPSVSGAGSVVASGNAFLSYSHTPVFTVAQSVNQQLDVLSTKVRRPAAGTLMAPLAVLVPTSHFGLRTSPITGSAGEFHWGQDFAAACGTNVYAADAGVVRTVGWHPWGGGNRVEIDHGNGLITTYNHLEGIGVKKGQTVQVGELIAKVGTTGASTGCHLHFETILNGKHADPDNWTLLRHRSSGPVAGVKMTDYRNGTASGTPNWAIPVGVSAHNNASDEGHETAASAVAAAIYWQPAASVSAATPSDWLTPLPAAKVAAPKPAKPVPAPKVAAPKPAKPAPAPKATAPKVTKPAPAPTVTAPKPTKPAPAPAPKPAPAPAPAPVVEPAPAPAPVVAPAPAPVV